METRADHATDFPRRRCTVCRSVVESHTAIHSDGTSEQAAIDKTPTQMEMVALKYQPQNNTTFGRLESHRWLLSLKSIRAGTTVIAPFSKLSLSFSLSDHLLLLLLLLPGDPDAL